jgi:hypothetical protein
LICKEMHMGLKDERLFLFAGVAGQPINHFATAHIKVTSSTMQKPSTFRQRKAEG